MERVCPSAAGRSGRHLRHTSDSLTGSTYVNLVGLLLRTVVPQPPHSTIANHELVNLSTVLRQRCAIVTHVGETEPCHNASALLRLAAFTSRHSGVALLSLPCVCLSHYQT